MEKTKQGEDVPSETHIVFTPTVFTGTGTRTMSPAGHAPYIRKGSMRLYAPMASFASSQAYGPQCGDLLPHGEIRTARLDGNRGRLE